MENSLGFRMLVRAVQDRLILHEDDSEEYAKYLRDKCLVEYNKAYSECLVTKED